MAGNTRILCKHSQDNKIEKHVAQMTKSKVISTYTLNLTSASSLLIIIARESLRPLVRLFGWVPSNNINTSCHLFLLHTLQVPYATQDLGEAFKFWSDLTIPSPFWFVFITIVSLEADRNKVQTVRIFDYNLTITARCHGNCSISWCKK